MQCVSPKCLGVIEYNKDMRNQLHCNSCSFRIGLLNLRYPFVTMKARDRVLIPEYAITSMMEDYLNSPGFSDTAFTDLVVPLNGEHASVFEFYQSEVRSTWRHRQTEYVEDFVYDGVYGVYARHMLLDPEPGEIFFFFSSFFFFFLSLSRPAS